MERRITLQQPATRVRLGWAGIAKPFQVCAAFVLLTLPRPAHAQARFAAATAPAQVVWDFESPRSSLGGQYNAYYRSPSWARTYLDPIARRAPGALALNGPSVNGHSLRVTAHRESQGFCGLWLQLASTETGLARTFDASAFAYLSFWIRGDKGGENFEISLADEEQEKREGSAPVRPLGAYVSGGAKTAWREVFIPLADFRGTNPARLAQMTINIVAPGDIRFYLDDIGFSREAGRQGDEPEVSVDSPPSGRGEPVGVATSLRRAMWVWDTRPYSAATTGAEATERLLAFCAAQGIQELYLSVSFTRFDFRSPPRAEVEGQTRDAQGVRVEIEKPEDYLRLLARAHKAGLIIDALAGSPEWAAKHADALAAVEAVAAFNQHSPETARFDGIHFDVEPYSLIGYVDPSTRAEILADFLEMVEKCRDRAKALAGLRFSCDVPAWFYPADDADRPALLVDFRRARKTVGEHLTDLLEAVTLMDYRNEADGAGGIIAAGEPALGYAALRKKRIVIGLETSLEPESTVHFVCGLPAEEFHRRIGNSRLRFERAVGEWPAYALADGANIHIGLGTRGELDSASKAGFEMALAGLARELGAAADPEHFPAGPLLERARGILRDNPEWQGFQPFEITDPESHQKIAGFRSVHRMPLKTTFHRMGFALFQEESRSAVEWLAHYPSFSGLAIHYYDSFSQMTTEK